MIDFDIHVTDDGIIMTETKDGQYHVTRMTYRGAFTLADALMTGVEAALGLLDEDEWDDAEADEDS